MREGSSGPGSGEREATRTSFGDDQAIRRTFAYPENSVPHPPTEVVRHPPTELRPPYQPAEAVAPYLPTEPARPGPRVPGLPAAGQVGATAERAWPSEAPAEVVRYGPGVPATPPAGQPGLTAEHVWRGGGPPKPPRRSARLRRLLAWGLTVILLAASGVLLYQRFHHAPFHVARVLISQRTQNGCEVKVTGMITTNGTAGTVSYQWVFRPDPHPPQPLSQTVIAGQRAVPVTVAVEGAGQGRESQTVTLQILGPDPMSASTPVVVSCR